jgi:hypothetical protein
MIIGRSASILIDMPEVLAMRKRAVISVEPRPQLPELAHRVGSLRCDDSAAIGGKADWPFIQQHVYGFMP